MTRKRRKKRRRSLLQRRFMFSSQKFTKREPTLTPQIKGPLSMIRNHRKILKCEQNGKNR